MIKIAAILAVLVSGGALAQSCPCTNANRVTGAALDTLVSGKTVCASFGGERWQEFHQGTGSLIDYKLGPGHAVDPSTSVGSWSRSGNTLVYNYGSGGLFSYEVCTATPGGPYAFCGVRSIVNVTILNGQSACP